VHSNLQQAQRGGIPGTYSLVRSYFNILLSSAPSPEFEVCGFFCMTGSRQLCILLCSVITYCVFLFVCVCYCNEAVEDGWLYLTCATCCLPPQLNCCVQIGLRPRYQQEAMQREVKLKHWSSTPLCIASCWLTSFGHKPHCTPHVPCCVKTWCHSQNCKYITYCTVVEGGARQCRG